MPQDGRWFVVISLNFRNFFSQPACYYVNIYLLLVRKISVGFAHTDVFSIKYRRVVWCVDTCVHSCVDRC